MAAPKRDNRMTKNPAGTPKFTPADDDSRVSIPLKPATALRGLLAVKPADKSKS